VFSNYHDASSKSCRVLDGDGCKAYGVGSQGVLEEEGRLPL
jgi:hypothetical protein